jgi:hypothetical protein
MGKASSSKKVARAARAGGRTTSGPRRRLGYPLGIAAIIVVGVLVVVFARGENSQAAAETPAVGDHIHNAYGIYVCDAFLPPLTDQTTDTTGLHTHGDGVIHIHPFNNGAAGKNATLAKWGQTTGVTFSSDGFSVAGTDYTDGYDCGGQPAEVSLYTWPADDPTASPVVVPAADIGRFRLDQDRLAITLAVVPPGTDVPRPESVPELDQLSDVPGAAPSNATPSSAPPATTAPGATTSAVPADGTGATTTSSAGGGQ